MHVCCNYYKFYHAQILIVNDINYIGYGVMQFIRSYVFFYWNGTFEWLWKGNQTQTPLCCHLLVCFKETSSFCEELLLSLSHTCPGSKVQLRSSHESLQTVITRSAHGVCGVYAWLTIDIPLSLPLFLLRVPVRLLSSDRAVDAVLGAEVVDWIVVGFASPLWGNYTIYCLS